MLAKGDTLCDKQVIPYDSYFYNLFVQDICCNFCRISGSLSTLLTYLVEPQVHADTPWPSHQQVPDPSVRENFLASSLPCFPSFLPSLLLSFVLIPILFFDAYPAIYSDSLPRTREGMLGGGQAKKFWQGCDNNETWRIQLHGHHQNKV